MSEFSSSILSGLEWDEGLSMPVANAGNKKLENQIQKKQMSLVSTQNELEETEERVRAMIEHLNNLQQELQNTQGLANAREKELQTENHLLQLTRREESRLRQEVTHLMKEMDRLKDKRTSFENNISKQSQKLEDLRLQMSWDKRALEAWFVESAKKDEDAMTIQKYTRQDEAKITALSHCIETLIVDAIKKKHRLQQEVTNTVTCQIELDKTAENFRNAHLERQELLSQWESTLELMKNRDRGMDALAIKLSLLKQQVRHNNKIMLAKQKQLRYEQDSNTQTEKKISLTERTSIVARAQLVEAEQQKMQFENESDAFKRTLDRVITDLDLARVSVTQVKQEIEEKHIKLQQAKETRVALDEKLNAAVASTLAVGRQATQMDDMLMAEEKRQERLQVEVKTLSLTLCNSHRERNEVSAEEKIMEAAINCAQNTTKNFASKIKRLDMETLKQQEILYNQSLIIQQLEKRCYRMQGEQTSEEKSLLEDKINDLQRDLDQKDENYVALMTQLRRAQDSQRRVEQDLARCATEKADLLIKIGDCNLRNVSLDAELRNIVKQKQNLMVSENLLKLEIKKLQDLLNSKTDTILSLETRKLQLDTVMSERQQEIRTHQEMLRAQINILDEERQQASTELYNKLSRIDKLKIRYKFTVIPMMPPSTEEEKSQVYILIKAAEEKEALQLEGDDLDARVRKAEKEILALENTLNLMNVRNDLYQESFKNIKESSEEMNIKRGLDEELKTVIDKYKYKKRQIQELQDDLLAASSTLGQLTKTESDWLAELENKKNKFIQMKKEIQEQQEKLQRADKHNKRLKRELRSIRKVLEELSEEKDIEVRGLRDFNRNLMMMIADAVQLLPHVLQTVRVYFEEADLPFPPVRNVRSGSLLSSKQGSLLSIITSSNGETVPTNSEDIKSSGQSADTKSNASSTKQES